MNNNKSKTKYEFFCEIGQKVKVRELNIKGKVAGIYVGPNVIQYMVRYFADGKPHDAYFEVDEIEIYTDEALGLGFKK